MYQHLFSKGKIGKLTLKNRIFKPAAADFGSFDGYVPESMMRFYAEEARGGMGLIIVGIADPDPHEGPGFSGHIKVENDQRIPGLGTLAEVIHDNGAKACLQITHFGSHGDPYDRCVSLEGLTNDHFYRLMLMPTGWSAEHYQEYSTEEIRQLIEAYGDAVVRMKTAGYDMAEVHCAHLHGAGQFLSPLTNFRTDEYGGTQEKRNRFLYDVIENIQQKVGKDYPISVRLNGAELPGGLTIDDTIAIAKELEQMGVAAINISSMFAMAPMQQPAYTNVPYAEAVRKAVSIPVLVAGSMNDQQGCEDTLASGKADFIGTARQDYADPYWPEKARLGQTEDIVPCIRCLECVNLSRQSWHGNLQCTMNPRVGKELTLPLAPISEVKNVAIVGGGPAGMEAALTAAKRGHHVTLFEKRALGGRVQEASVPVFKQDLKKLIRYYKRQLEKHPNITVIKKKAGVEDLRSFDAVIVATGAKRASLPVPGTDSSNVYEAIDWLQEQQPLGEKVVIIGGGSVGVESAIMAANSGKEVTIVEMIDHLMNGEDKAIADLYYEMLRQGNVKVLLSHKLQSIQEGIVTVRKPDGTAEDLPVDNVLLAVGLKADLSLYDALAEAGMADIYFAGDCETPKKIFDAIHAGFACGNQV